MGVGAGISLLRESVVIDYTSLDAEAIENDMRTYALTQWSDRWTHFQASGFSVVFLKLYAYLGDMMNFHWNSDIGETQPSTAKLRSSFINIAVGYDFRMRGPVGSSPDLEVVSLAALLPLTLEADTYKVNSASGAVFMPAADTLITDIVQSVPFVAGDRIEEPFTSTGDIAQEFELGEGPLLWEFVPDIGNRPRLQVFVNGVPWVRSTTRSFDQSTAEVFYLDTDKDDISFIAFGDGVNGKVPPAGATILAVYSFGNGDDSNINPRTITNPPETPVEGVVSVNNPETVSGGLTRQSLKEARSALPATIKTNDRAVTDDDYGDILLSPQAPSGVAKASSFPGPTSGNQRRVFVWVVPTGFGVLSNSLRNDIAQFLLTRRMVGTQPFILDREDIEIVLTLGVFVHRNFRNDDVVGKVRALFVTEDPAAEVQAGAFDPDNLGLRARDDTGEPQLTIARIHKLTQTELADAGVQKVVVEEFRIRSIGKLPLQRTNTGNGTLSSLTYLASVANSSKPRETARREFRVLFNSPTTFTVFRRVVGNSTLLTDTQLIDDRLDLGNQPDFVALPSGSVLNPFRGQSLVFPVDEISSTGNTVQVAPNAAGSVFGTALPGQEYYIEFQDGTGVIGATNSVVTYSSPVGDVEFSVSSGSIAFTSTDELTIDLFPFISDLITLREDELPVFTRDAEGRAIDFTTVARTAR